MKVMNRLSLCAALVAAVIFNSSAPDAAAAWWNPGDWFSASTSAAEQGTVLMVAGNYAKPRLLAELAQKQNGQPILLISPTPDGGEELYYLPRNPVGSMAESKKNFVRLVDASAPKQIIFIGDSDYMPMEYIELLRNRYPVVVIVGDNWDKNAATLANLFRQDRLPELFARDLKVYEDAVSRRPVPGVLGGAGAVPAEPTVNSASKK